MTDMYHHSKLVQSLDSLVAAGPNETGVPLLNSFNANGRSIVLQMIVHAADISNTCRPPGPCGLWAKRVTDGEDFGQLQNSFDCTWLPMPNMAERDGVEPHEWTLVQHTFVQSSFRKVTKSGNMGCP